MNFWNSFTQKNPGLLVGFSKLSVHEHVYLILQNSVILCIPNSVNPIFGKKLIYTLLLFKMWEEKASELINKVK